jgi:hypothetical protein
MKHSIRVLIVLTALFHATGALADDKFRSLPLEDYLDKMKAGWIGQMAGVGWGAPTEFTFKGSVIPLDRVPKWNSGKINQFNQDDIYVEMTFLRTLENHGFDVSIRQAGIDFANSQYKLWHANRVGRENLRKGIAPPDSGHPQYNKHADDIDYQIEADFSGLIAPGMPNVSIQLGETFGRLMNYGDGVYGGQFVGGMYAEAFFEQDVVKIVEAGLRCIPAGSQYAEMVRDVLKWSKKNADDWQHTWKLVEEKYHQDPQYTHGLCSNPGGNNVFGIDAKLNGAYILIGLLHGKGDIEQTIVISMRCGQDSDCNPSSAAGIIFTSLGYSKLPARFTSALDPKSKFSHTSYDFPALIKVCTELTRQVVERNGGRIENDDSGKQVLIIHVQEIRPSALMKSWDPAPSSGEKLSEDELKRLTQQNQP